MVKEDLDSLDDLALVFYYGQEAVIDDCPVIPWDSLDPGTRLMIRTGVEALQNRLEQEWVARAQRALALVDPGPKPDFRGSPVRQHAYFEKQKLYRMLRACLTVEEPGEVAPIPDEPGDVPADPDVGVRSGWTPWISFEQSIYRGLATVRIWCIAPGRFSVYAGNQYLDSYDDLDEAKAASRAYVESLWAR